MTKTWLCVVVVLVACQSGNAPTPTPAPRAPAQTRAPVSITPMRVVAGEPVAQTDVTAPFTLTASDGSGLVLSRIDAKAVVDGPLAFSELHLYFKNPENRTREGTFAITLPSGAAVSRFAMETDGKWQEAEVVEKAMARRVYDDYLHRKQDPALLEKAAGNQFTARVFPIPSHGEKHLVVSFSQELAGRGYTLPLRGLPATARVDVSLTTTSLDGTLHTQSLSEKDWQPDRDFIAQISDVPAAVTTGNLVVGALAIPDAGATSLDPPRGITLLVDTSASRALGFAAYVDRVRELVAALKARYGDDLRIDTFAFDQFLQPIAVDGIVERGAAGASNLDSALRLLAPFDHQHRLVVITDGVMTAGPDTPTLVDDAKKAGFDRIDVVLSGGIRDERLAASLARALPHAGDVFDLDRGIATIAEGLGQAVSIDVAIDIPGATWVYPRVLPSARPGSTQMVFAKLPKPTRTIDVVVGNTRRTIGLGASEAALIERAVAGAEIEEMETKLATAKADEAQQLREAIAKESVGSRVVSSQTSMLVLESDADYERYKIPRTALADILTVGPRGTLEQKHRTMLARTDTVPDTQRRPDRADGHFRMKATEQDPQLARQQAIDEARNAGALGSTALLRDDAPQAGGSFASLTGKNDIASGFESEDVYGGLFGGDDEGGTGTAMALEEGKMGRADSGRDTAMPDPNGDVQGQYGFGRSGFGPGGGGTGWGTIGTGRYGTIGRGSGTGGGYGLAGGRGGMRARTSTAPSILLGQPTTNGSLDKAIIRRYIKRNLQKLQYCYEKELLAHPSLHGAVTVTFVITDLGTVSTASGTGVSGEVASCVAGVIQAIEFPRPTTSALTEVSYPFTFAPADPIPPPSDIYDGAYENSDYDDGTDRDGDDRGSQALTGKLADVTAALKAKNIAKAIAIAKPWHDGNPGDVLALIAYAQAVQSTNPTLAARLYGSIIDLFPSRADMRRFAGERLEASSDDAAMRDLVVDTYRKAVADRPDHATGHRLLAYALLRVYDYQGALDAILAGVDHDYPADRYLGADRVMREDAAIIAAVYIKAQPDAAKKVIAELGTRDLTPATRPSTRFVMYWETDANDVDFHIRDARGGHAWYRHKKLRSGGRLYADITTGYGPECFTIPGKPSAGPYKLSINYFSQGPMGYGMGLLQILEFDGTKLVTQDRPYVIMTDEAFVDLGSYRYQAIR